MGDRGRRTMLLMPVYRQVQAGIEEVPRGKCLEAIT